MQMPVNVWVTALLLILAISGCVSPLTSPPVGRLSSDQYARFKSMAVSREPTTRPHTMLGSVKGLSCSKNINQQISEEEAIEGVQLRAALLDADAIVNVVCKTSGVDWVNNCRSAIICAGDAIRYKQ